MKLLRISFFAAQQSFMTTAPLGAQSRQGGIFVCLRPHFHVVRATPRVVMDVRVITRLADRRAVHAKMEAKGAAAARITVEAGVGASFLGLG